MDSARAVADFLVRFFDVVFSWPVAALVLAYWFRQPLSALLNGTASFLSNLRRLKGMGVEAELAVSSQQEVVAPASDPIAPTSEPAAPPPTSPAASSTPAASRPPTGSSLPAPRSPFHAKMIDVVWNAENLKGKTDREQLDIMAYWFAAQYANLGHERTHRLIFASQLQALYEANAGVLLLVRAREIFDLAPWPASVPPRNFDQWLGWLIKPEDLLAQTGNQLHITERGQDFLRYVVDWKMPVKQY